MTIFNKNTPLCLGFPLATQIYTLALQRDAKKLCQSLFVPSSVNSTVFFHNIAEEEGERGRILQNIKCTNYFCLRLWIGRSNEGKSFLLKETTFNLLFTLESWRNSLIVQLVEYSELKLSLSRTVNNSSSMQMLL